MTKRKGIHFILGVSIFVLISIGYMKFHRKNINDIGLEALSYIKKVKGETVDLKQIQLGNTTQVDHQKWSDLLKKHVSKTGQVNYKAWSQNHTELDQYLTTLSQNIPGKNWTEPQKMAYWINAYNAFTIKLILNHYPLKSIKEISDGTPMINSPWDLKFFQIDNVDFDLNAIEHQILRKEFQEPRIHFAINCASISCPKLRNEAYFATRLEAQLEQQAKEFIHDPTKNIINADQTSLSAIFNWFQSDFTRDGDLLMYLKKYQPALNQKNKVVYLSYNWNLNE
jgi:hypothetical protein